VLDAFERFAERKTRLATEAHLPPYRTEYEDPPARASAIGNAWSRELFDGPFYVSAAGSADRPACSLVFVQSSDGNTVTPDPSRLGGGDTDLHLIYEGLSRVAADAVLAGAETVRGSKLVFSVWHPELADLRISLGLPRHPVQIVATLRGLELDRILLFNVPAIPVMLVTLRTVAKSMDAALCARPWVTPVLMDRPGDLPRALTEIRSKGIARISCIGGRTLARQLLEARLIDEIYLTTGNRQGGEPDTPLFSGAPWGRVSVRKQGTGVEQGVIFEHRLP
jgi:riboflavin biosynthesis pyrimidine reductase